MVNRIPPALPVQAMQTYSIRAPLATHWRDATCAEVDCPQHLHGWLTAVDETTELGQAQAGYIRARAGRRYIERRTPTHTEFLFEAGQRCFAPHKVPLEREPLFIVRLGDWRGYGPARVHARADDWIEDMQESLDKIRDARERG